MASKKKLDEILKKVNSGTLSVKSDINQTRGDRNHTQRGVTSSRKTDNTAVGNAGLSKPTKITADVSGEAWTRATPSQTTLTQDQQKKHTEIQLKTYQTQLDQANRDAYDWGIREEQEFLGGFVPQDVLERTNKSKYKSSSEAKQAAQVLGQQKTSLLNQNYENRSQDILKTVNADKNASSALKTAQGLEDLQRKIRYELEWSSAEGIDRSSAETRKLGLQYGLTEAECKNIWSMQAAITKKLKQAKAAVEKTGVSYDDAYEYLRRQELSQEAASKKTALEKELDDNGLEMTKHTGLSVLANMGKGVDYVAGIAGNWGHNDERNLDTYRPMNSDAMSATNYVNTVRGKVGSEIQEDATAGLKKLGASEGVAQFGGEASKFLYDTGMSIVDNAAQMAVAGVAGAGTAGTSAIVSGLMGTGAAADQMKNILDNGGTNDQAMVGGFAAGVAEALFEKVSIDALLAPKNITNFKSWAKEALKQGGVEASEEVCTELANMFTDALIRGQDSDFQRAIAYYQTEEGGGLSLAEAKKKAYLDAIGQVALAGLGGFISGGVMQGVKGGVEGLGYARQARTDAAIDNAYKVMMENGMFSPEARKASQAALRMRNPATAYTGVDAETLSQYNETKVSPAASAEVQQTEAQAQVTQAENPDVNVLDAATTLFTKQGMKLKTAQEKAGIVQKLIAGEDVSVRDINKLNPDNPKARALFTQLTGVQFPDGKVTPEQLYNLYRSAHDVAVQAREQQRVQQQAREAELQQAAMERVQSVQEQQETPAVQEQQATDTLAKQMADAGFQANPETQDRIAQAQAELNDAVNGTTTAASRKTGNARNSITLKTGDTLTRDQFKQVMQELYAEKGINLTDNQLDAAFNNFLSTADRGGDISGLEAMAEYLKSKEDNNGAEGTEILDGGLRGDSDIGAGEQNPGVSEVAGRTETENRRGGDSRPEGGDGRGVHGHLPNLQEGRQLSDSARFAENLRAKNPKTETRNYAGLEDVNVITEDKYLTPGMKRFRSQVEEMGGNVAYCMGEIRIKNGTSASGVYDASTQTLLIRADNVKRDIATTMGHEFFHFCSDTDSGLMNRVFTRVIQEWGIQDMEGIDALISRGYSKSYGENYGEFNEESKAEYYEEFLADVYGGIPDRLPCGSQSGKELFELLHRTAVEEVKAWQSSRTEQNNDEQNSTAQDNTGKPSSSLKFSVDESDKTPQFKNWDEAFMHFETLIGSNLAFADPPVMTSEMEFGYLDSHGKWYETIGTYSKDAAGLAKFNEDVKDFISTYEISDEELNALFPPTDGDFADDGYGYNYEDQDADVPGFLSDIYARSQKEASDAVQTNRDGFTKTDTKAFQKWFNDPSGEFTNPDGQPKVFLRGSIYMGATKAHAASEAKSKGIFFTTDPSVAQEYASGVSSGENTTLMDEIKGDENLYLKELQRKYFRGWGPAKDYILRHFQAYGNGLRLVGLDANGNEVSRISDAETFSLQTNAATDEQFRKEGWFAEDKWRELASFPKTKQGLEDFNYRLGDIIRENKLGIRGYGKYFLTSDNTLVVDAEGYDYHGIRSDVLPTELRNGDTYVHIDNIAERAFQNGYDAVVVKNVEDAGGAQTQYIVKNSSQVKSVYNRGTWDNTKPDFLFLAENEDHRQKLEDFFKKMEEEYGGGSAEAMFQTFEQLDRARQRAEERAADAEAAQQAAEWATEAAVEAARMAERERSDKKLQKQKDAFQEKARQKAAEARLSKAKAVRDARLAEQMNAGRQWAAKLRRQDERATAKAEAMRKSAEERMSQLRAGHQQELDDTRLAERMNAGRKVAQAKRKGLDAVAREKAKREQDHKLASKDAKTAASVLRKYHKADTEKLTNAPVSTLREAYHKPTAKDAVKAAADKLRTAHREFYKAFINGTQAVDDFSKYQKVDANTSVLLRTAMASGSTIQSIRQDHLVGKDGSVIDERSLADVVICWDGSGKHRKYNDDKQRVLQDYMLHRHNIDRMSFREKALNAVESYEQSYPWLASLEPREFAELVADGNRIAQRYQELIEQFQKAKDKPIFTDSEGKPVTAEFSRNLVSQYEQQYDWVKEKAEGIYDWWDKFMQEWVVGDSLSAEEYATLRETYPAYVPTYRKDKPGLGKGVSSFGGTVTAKKAVRAATGGTSAVANIEDSFNMLMEKNVSSQRTNMVLRSITDTAMLDDAGDFNGFAVFDWNEAPEMLRWGLAAEGFEGALEAGTDQAAAKALSKDDGGVYRVRAWANGERVSAIVDPELYKALDFAFNQKTGWFTKVGQTLTSPMKTFITGINPAFAMRNTIRDNLTAQMNSISVVNSISGIKFEKYYAKAWQEMVSGSENWQHFVALGGTNAGYYNNEGGTYITNLNRQKMQDLNPINKVGKALGFIGEHTEQVTRFAEYLATIDRLPGGDTYGNRLVGIKNAAEVTVDFSRKGTLGKAFNAWIPYWNPTVQGIDKTVRTFFDQPTVDGKAKVLSRAALTTLPLDILLFAIYHALDRDDEWEELSDRTKDTYYCIPLPDEHKFLKIPKSRDWGQIIGNPIMRMLQGLDGREDPFENYFEVSIKPNFLWSNPLDAILLSTQYDLAKNEDFAGRAIVPSNYQKMAKGDQWNSDTSKYAKVIADIGNMFVEEDWLSPMQLDYIINDYFGDFGSMFQRLFSIGGNDKQASAEEQAKMVAEDLLGNWVADNRYSSATVSDYYDMLDKVSQEVAAERVQNPDGYKDTPMYKLNSAFNAKGSASDQITELNAQVRELPDGPEKDAIKGQIVELAREALQMYDAVMAGDITEPKMEMEYSKYGDKVKNALTDLADYSEDYAFLPSDYKPSSYTDPKNKNKEYVLDDAAKAKYRELYDEEYANVMEAVIKSSKYRSASAEKRAELLEAARDDVAPQVKEEFLKWLAKNYKSTPKKK